MEIALGNDCQFLNGETNTSNINNVSRNQEGLNGGGGNGGKIWTTGGTVN